MRNSNNKTGLLALLGVALGGAFAWYRYKTATPEEKAKIKNAIDKTGNRIKETYRDVEDSISDGYDKVSNNVKKEL